MTTPTIPLDAAPLAIQRPTPLYLVDASLYVFRAWHSIPDEFQDAQGWPTNAVHGFARFLLDLLEREDPQHITIAFDEALDSCFRHAIYPAYKGNRTPAPDALRRQFAHCKALCAALGLSVLAHRDYEADDLIGSALHSVRAHGLRGVIVSADKDLSQLLLEHDEQWDYARNQRWGIDGVKARHGVHAHQIADYLALCGDAIDNIPGVTGIGAKSAAVLLAHFGSLDALLERIDEIPFLRLRGAAQMAVRLREQREHALLWRQLTTIALDAPLALTEAGFTRAHADADMLTGLCESLRFGPLTRRRLLAASTGVRAAFPPVFLAQGPRP
ncbi:exodeoxyribonuclease IX [Xanthomonas citri pv. fuscans CFBP 6996]|uniref:5'-3' exonuclease n=1 Tax=Xanthomonas citri TaxID=346 RepID=UPI000C192CCA|nr:5'-3' exonuclease H3TH domain-containing protein [Xanthomonas citri]ATS50657.1 exodeoxyribonuclease IX [Xanthomonas citri pv. phaseoli var. fuscans]ATS56392.1 exodeoxyribonuclease IX [Xanthomonas citri pv. phaseoli var. fuscans]ATS59599.1 exodeoxyribonuclease IX [Xanthomonas citri pv. phaseoli var. fuscans]PTY31330.1 exodeoxyribonuclease IX [Xanthomonas citri pv. fuscans CFBP 6996]QWN15265.1 exodeoxyribonuclease IX [Xanthomonas citri]